MDVAVARAAAAADGDRGGAVGEVDGEFFLEGFAEFGRFQRLHEFAKTRAEFQRIERKTAGLFNARVIGIEAAQGVRLDEARKYQMLVRIAQQRSGAKCFEIEKIVDHAGWFTTYLGRGPLSMAWGGSGRRIGNPPDPLYHFAALRRIPSNVRACRCYAMRSLGVRSERDGHFLD